MTPPTTVQQNTSPMIAITSAATPSPFLGPIGGGSEPGVRLAVAAAGSWSCR